MNAITAKAEAEPPLGTFQDDGSMVITADELRVLGAGSASRGKREVRAVLAADRALKVSDEPTKRPASVRLATGDDEAAVFNLVMLALKEDAISVAPIDPVRVLEHIVLATQQKGGVMGIVHEDGVLVGLTIMLPTRWWWSKQYHLQELMTFVHPDHRKRRHVDDLLQFNKWAVETWTQGFGYQIYLVSSILGLKRVREKILLYRRKFQMVGMSFLYPSAGEE